MIILSYSDWHSKYGEEIVDEVTYLLEALPYGLGECIDLEYHLSDILEEAYCDYVSDAEDRAYDEYRDSLLDLGD